MEILSQQPTATSELLEYVQGRNDLEILPTGRLKCTNTGHELVADLQYVKQYMEGKKYQKYLTMYSTDYSKYEPYIVTHRDNPKFLFCNLTKVTLPKKEEVVDRHVQSRKYQAGLEKWRPHETPEGSASKTKKEKKIRTKKPVESGEPMDLCDEEAETTDCCEEPEMEVCYAASDDEDEPEKVAKKSKKRKLSEKKAGPKARKMESSPKLDNGGVPVSRKAKKLLKKMGQ